MAWISCRTASYGKFESLAFEHLASLGVRHVEIPVPAPNEIEQTKAALARHGLAAASLHGECDVSRADCAAQVAAQMPAFQALSTRYLFVSCKAADVPLETVYRRLREAAAAAARGGVTIVMETHPDLITNGTVARQTMQAVDRPNVRVNFDTANIYYYNRDIDALAELRQIIGFVGALHLKDTNGGYHAWHFPALGRGIVNFPGIFELLEGVGFGGPLTLEIEGCEGETPTERRVCDRIAESVGYLRGLGRL